MYNTLLLHLGVEVVVKCNPESGKSFITRVRVEE